MAQQQKVLAIKLDGFSSGPDTLIGKEFCKLSSDLYTYTMSWTCACAHTHTFSCKINKKCNVIKNFSTKAFVQLCS